MGDRKRVAGEAAFEIELPAGWDVEPDTEGGVLLTGPGEGLLHLVGFAQPEAVAADPAEELYAFLEEQGVELMEDEVEDVELGPGAELAYCEYLTEDEEDEEGATYWLVGVATAPGSLIFGSYSCPAGRQDMEREAVRAILAGIRPEMPPLPE